MITSSSSLTYEAPPRYKHMSLIGGYTMAAKRNHGYAGAAAMCKILDVDSSRFTLPRWEVNLACALMLWARSWYTMMYSFLDFVLTGASIGISFEARQAMRCDDDL